MLAGRAAFLNERFVMEPGSVEERIVNRLLYRPGTNYEYDDVMGEHAGAGTGDEFSEEKAKKIKPISKP